MLHTLKRKNKKGFTLIELIVVVAILAILAAIAVPSFIGLQDRAKQGVEIADASAIAGAINVFNAMQANDGDKITDAADAQDMLDDMWPIGVSSDGLDRVTVGANFVATVNSTIE